MKVSVIVCAAGSGERAGFGKNKLLVPFMGATPLYHSLSAFDFLDAQKIAVCAEGDVEAQALCKKMGFTVALGGATRTESVYNALKIAEGDTAVIHDGARPFVTKEIIEKCVECAKTFGSAICAYGAVDTVAITKDGGIFEVPERAHTFIVQTPQCFNLKEIKSAYERAISDGNVYTDDGAVYSRYIRPARVCACGSPHNRKLTFKEDFIDTTLPPLPRLEGNYKVGFGVDTHAFGKAQNYVTLCGVEVPCDEGLIAHSDGDVAVHAAMDALLCAAGLRDIGFYFPDGDDRYLNADSMKLLERVVKLVKDAGYMPVNLTLTVQAEKPRLSGYIEQMKKNLAKALGLEGGVAVLAGSAEGLGFVGRKLGINCYAVATVEKIK